MNIISFGSCNNIKTSPVKEGKQMKSPEYLINEQRLIDTFIKMAKIDTGSNEELAETKIPSTDCQKDFARILHNKLTEMGLKNVQTDEYGFVTAVLKSNIGDSPVIGLLAHMDTSSEAPAAGVNPQIHEYNGGDIVLKNNVVIGEKELSRYKGNKIITSDGTTLLGADDKAGIAEIIEAVNVFNENPELKHPEIRIAFTPDEETGLGITKFDIEKFGADAAYTIDGDLPEIIEDETFNAFNPEIKIKGKSVHTGYAKDGGMINAVKIAAELVNKLPKDECPEKTQDRQGFYHVSSLSGNTSQAKINLLVRDHDMSKAKERIAFLEKITDEATKEYGCEITFDKKERYHNMKEYTDKFPETVEFAKEGIRRSGLIPQTKAIRGGTDGSDLSVRGLPTPNLGAGGINFHSVRECVCVETMKKCVENILNIMAVWAENADKISKK